MLTALIAATTLMAAAPTNIVYIMADDLGYGELGCYGQQRIPTPNIDRLAAEGMRFTRAYAPSPVCAPTRYSLMTGKHQGNAAIRGNKEAGGFGPNEPEGQTPIAAGDTTIAEALKAAGYRTGIVGKWGLGGPAPGETPMDHGFDTFYGYLCQRRAHTHYPVYLWSNHQPELLPGNRMMPAHQRIQEPLDDEDAYYERFWGETYAPEKMAEACVEFIDANKDSPFFLYYAPTLPHVALHAPREWVERFPEEWDPAPYLGDKGYTPAARPRATYAAMIAYLDHTVGMIAEALERNGLAQNTLVVFTSDNGATFNGGMDREFFRSNGELRAGKMSLYEGGVRVPFVARWPGRVAPGSVADRVTTGWDTFATLLEVAGLPALPNDGESYLPTLLGQRRPVRESVYFEYPEASAMQAVILDERWKVIRPNLKEKPELVELYDLNSDPGEKVDLASDRPELVRRGLQLMERLHVPNPMFPLGAIDAR